MFNSFLGSTLFFIFSRRFRINSSSLTDCFVSGLTLCPKDTVNVRSSGWSSSISSNGRILSPYSYLQSILRVWNSGKNSSQHWFQLNHRAGLIKVPLFLKDSNSLILSHSLLSLITDSPASKAILSLNSCHRSLKMVWDSQKDAIIVCFWEEYSPLPKGL